MECTTIKPLLKWVGGKTQILDEVFKYFPRNIRDYHEPFVGGGSVLLALLSMVKQGKIQMMGTCYASDVNPRLISLYTNVQQQPCEVIEELKRVVDIYNQLDGTVVNRKPKTEEEARTSQESYYYWIRKVYNAMSRDEQLTCKASAYFIFLNKTCFRGLYREGPNGFNVPFGHYKKPSIYDAQHVQEVSALITDVVFTCQSFDASLSHASVSEFQSSGDFVYLDPPYAPENSSSFVGYTAGGFSGDMHAKLFTMCKQLTDMRSVGFVMSNADVELVRNNFPNDMYEVHVVVCKRCINSKKPGSKTNELIIKWTGVAAVGLDVIPSM